ncbi:MAG: PAS domain S-box protein [Chloroflexi bacterium]|nr:PAS domain S-box protein [Chloroflexota bacterium]
MDVNRQACESLGYSREELVGVTPADFDMNTTPDFLEQIVTQLAIGDVVAFDARHRRKDGTTFPVEVRIRPFRESERRFSVSLVRDISERKQAELEREHLLNHIQQQAKEVQFIIDTVPEAMFLLSENGHVRLTNSMAEQYLALLAPGWETEELTHLGQYPLADLLTSPPKGLWHDVILDNWRFELIARPVENGPTNQGWVFVIRDVTREREIQQHVQAQERLAAVGQLAAGIAHDFNNTLAVIRLYTDLLLRTLKLPPRAEERLHILEQQTQRASDLIQQILDFSRQSVVERQPLNLLPFLKELVRLLRRTLPESIDVELEYNKDAYVIHADPSRIQQAIMNLAVNARDAMPEGGHLTIHLTSFQLEPGATAPVLEMTPGAWIEIGITDSGTGIPSEVLAHIFEPFFTTKERGQGTGLGLAQVYGIVQQHDGFIGVETEMGGGTTFRLYFPVYAVTWQSRPQPLAAALPQGQGQVVLIVEDEDAIRQALVEGLDLLNYRHLEARNGREALSVLAQHSDQIALVLSDAVMPQMGGVALFHALREQKLAIPFVIVTGHAVEKDMENLRALGLYGWLKKPLELSKLAELLAQGLEREDRGSYFQLQKNLQSWQSTPYHLEGHLVSPILFGLILQSRPYLRWQQAS